MDAKDDRRALLQSALEAVETMQAKLAAAEHARTEPIAIVGLGCRLPGAEDPAALWRLLRDGVDAVREVPRDRWDPETIDTAALDERGRAAARLGGFLERVDLFEPAFFAISPREALTLDPQQRLLLEVTWEALEDAAQAADQLHGSLTGVFIGITTSDYAKLVGVGEGDQTDVYAATGNALNAAAGRLAFTLGLHGPCMAVDTACSSSLTAIHIACQSLRAGECDLALAGGVNVVLAPDAALLFARWGMLAADGRCKTFDAAADGFVRSEGCGVIVLKRLSAALAAGDRVRAVILGSAVNQDGASSGLTVPNGPAQEAVIRRALAVARLQPHEVDYVEAHGTGTPLGDPIEVEALAAVMAPGRPVGRPLAIGSIKTNIGHPEAASGVAGLLKVVLALEHEAIPPHVHFRERSPRIPWPGDAIYVPARLTPWARGKRRRIAGVSSFGFSGTNAHVIVAEPPVPAAPVAAATADRPWHLVTVSGRTEAALKAGAERLAAHLGSDPDLSLPDVGYTRNAGRSHLAHRAAVIAKDTAAVRERLLAVASGAGAAGVRQGSVQAGQRPRVAWLFTGQGSQYAGMGQELYRTQPVFRRALERCDAALRTRLERPLLEVVFGSPESAALLDETAYTQPVLFALEWALAELWRGWGIVPAAVMGHSVGEIAAAAVAGVLTPEDGAILAAERGRLMQACRRGAMTAVLAREERVQQMLTGFRGTLSLAAVNGPESTVVSGEPDAMVAFRAACDADGIQSKPLTVSHAFHSPMMEPMLDALEQCARGLAHVDPQVELISNLTGDAAKPGEVGPAYWRRHAREAVRFEASMRALRDRGCDVFLEVGPQPTLLGMGRRCVEGGVWLPSLRPGQPEWSTLLESLAELYVKGAPIDWAAFDAEWPRRKLFLPGYAFQRSRHWVEPVSRIPRDAGSGSTRRPTPGAHPLVGTRLRSPRLQDTIFEYRINAGLPEFLDDHRIFGVVVFPAAAYIESIVASVFSGFAERNPVIEDLTFDQAIVLADGEERVMQGVFTRHPDRDGEISVQLLSRDSRTDDDNWRLHVNGKVHVGAPLHASSQLVPSSSSETLEMLTARFSEEINPDTYYERFRQLGLGYGLQFRGIRRLWRRPGEALGQIQLPDSVESAVRQYCLHPGILDSAFQLLGVTLEGDMAGEGPIYVPVGIARLRILGPNATPLVGHAVLRHKSDSARGEPVADIRLFDGVGRMVVEVEGLELRRVTRATLERVQPKPYLEWLYEVNWEEKALDVPAAVTGERVVVLRGQDKLGARLGKVLRDRGAVVSEVTDGEGADLGAVLKEVVGDTPCHVVALGALEAPDVGAMPPLQPERTVCSGTLWLVQALARRQVTTRLYLVTSGAQAVGEAPEVSPVQAALCGLARTVALEHPELACVQVDLEPGSEDAEALGAELGAGDGEDQVAYRGGKRYVARLVRSKGRPATPTPEEGQALQLQIATRGVLDNLKLVAVNRRVPGKGEVEIQVEAAGLNFRDVLNALAMYPGDPGLLGGECAGRIVAVGAGVEGLQVGDPVVGLAYGALSSYVTTEARVVARVPRGVSVEEGATIPIVFLTAHYGLNHLARVKRGERVLIHAAAGGVGMAAVQFAQRAGAEIFATAGSPKKRAVLQSMGVPHVLDSRSLTFADEIMARTRGEGIDIVLNSLTGDFIPKSLALLRRGGRFLEIGKRGIWDHAQVRRMKPEIEYHVIYLGEVVEQQPALVQEMLRELIEAFEAGNLVPLPRVIFSLRDAASAFRYMAQAKHVGKVVLRQDVGGGRISPGATYLVTGGLGALGLEVAKWLVAEGARHLVLVGRHGPRAAAQTVLAELAQRGARVVVRQADVAQAGEVQALLDSLGAQPPLRGIIHAAGVLEDGVLLQQSWERFARVLAPKALGAWHLHRATEGMGLDFFVLFSSMASVLGSAGQGNYAAANACLDGLAWYRRGRGLPALSINWGPWGEVGMAAQLDQRDQNRQAAAGIRPIPPALGVQALGNPITIGVPQAAVLPVDWAEWARRYPDLAKAPFFSKVLTPTASREEGGAVANENRAAARTAILAAPAEERCCLVQVLLTEQVMRVMRLPAEALDIQQPLRTLGLDSLMAVEIRNRIEAGLGVAMPLVNLLEGPSIMAIAKDVGARLGESPAPAKPTQDVNDAVRAAQLLERMDDLSDADVHALLEQLLPGSDVA